MIAQVILWGLLILPWGLFFFLDIKKVKKFIPGGLFSALVLTVFFQFYERYQLFEINKTIFPLTNTTPFIYGIYIVLPTIFLYFTFGHFFKYILLNMVSDAIFAFGIMYWYEHLGIYKLEGLHHIIIYTNSLISAVLIYLFQKWQYNEQDEY
ncbi:MAG: hypothetical protein ABF649_11805 [Bacillus sp. (in: firmicutes)]